MTGTLPTFVTNPLLGVALAEMTTLTLFLPLAGILAFTLPARNMGHGRQLLGS